MTKVLNLRKHKKTGLKTVITVVVSVIITAAGIKAGDNFLSKEKGGSANDGPCPAEMVAVSSPLGGFCIDKYEASPSSECPHMDPANQTETTVNLDYQSCKAETKKGVTPWRNISQDQARTACAKAGKRLATNQEWLQAALGTPDQKAGWTQDDCQVDNNWPSQPGLTGFGQNCVSPVGAYDMVGNVWEWVDGAAQDGVYDGKQLPESGFVDSLDGESLPAVTNASIPNENYHEDYFWIKANGVRGIVRGGYWNNKSDAGQYSAYIVAPPSSTENGIGFRCVK
jgi:formylglycine-generating enzyme required for sulfatase activity